MTELICVVGFQKVTYIRSGGNGSSTFCLCCVMCNKLVLWNYNINTKQQRCILCVDFSVMSFCRDKQALYLQYFIFSFLLQKDFLKNYQGRVHMVEREVEKEYLQHLRSSCYEEKYKSK